MILLVFEWMRKCIVDTQVSILLLLLGLILIKYQMDQRINYCDERSYYCNNNISGPKDGIHIVMCDFKALLFLYSTINYSLQIKEKVICFSTLKFVIQDFSVTILLILVKLITCWM